MKDVKAEIILEFIENGIPAIESKIDELKERFSYLERVTQNISFNSKFLSQLKTLNQEISEATRNIAIFKEAIQNNFNTFNIDFGFNNINKTKEQIKDLEKHLKTLNSKNLNFNIENIDTAFSNIVKLLKEINKINVEVQRLETAIKQSKKALVELNNIKLDNLKRQMNDLDLKNLIKDLNKLEKTLNTASSMRELQKTGEILDKDLKKIQEINKLSKVFTNRINEISRGNKTSLSQILDLNQLKKYEEEFEKAKTYALQTYDIKPLRDFIKEFKALSDTWESSLNTNLNKVTNVQSQIKKISQTTEADLAKIRKKEIAGLKKLEQQINKTLRASDRTLMTFQEHINVRKQWTPQINIKNANTLVNEYKKQMSILDNIRQSMENKLASGHIFAYEELNRYSKAIEKTNEKLAALDKQIRKTKAQLNETSHIKRLIQSAQTAVTYSGLYLGLFQVYQTIGDSVRYVLEFNQAQQQMAAVLNISTTSAKKLEAQLAHLGITYGGTLKSINQAALALARAGIESSKVAKATEIVIKMAKLTGDTFESSSGALITFMTVYKDTGVSLHQLGDELAYVANQSKLSTEDINTFANYALQAAKAVGITRHMVEAMAIAFSNAGTRAETIGTTIRRLATLATDNSTAVQNFFDRIGLSQKRFSFMLTSSKQDANRVMLELSHKLARLSDREFQEVTAGMEILAKQSLTRIRENADEIEKQFNHLQKGVTGELDRANIVTESYIGTWEKLKNTFGETFRTLTIELFPVIQKIMYKLINLANFLTTNMPTIRHYLDVIKQIILAIGSMMLISKLGEFKRNTLELLPIVTKLASTTKQGVFNLLNFVSNASIIFTESITKGTILTGVVEKLGIALRFLATNPIGLLITGLTTASVILYNMLDNNQKVTRNLIKPKTDITEEELKKMQKLQVERSKLIAQLDKLAKLEKIQLNKGEADKAQQTLNKIIELRKQLQEIDTQLGQTKTQQSSEQTQKLEKAVQLYSKLYSLREEEAKFVQKINEYRAKNHIKTLQEVDITKVLAQEELKRYTTIKQQINEILKYGSSVKEIAKNLPSETSSKDIKKQQQDLKTIIKITDEHLAQYDKWKTQLQKLDKQNINVTRSISVYTKQLTNDLKQALSGFKVYTNESFSHLFKDTNLKGNLKTEINNLLKSVSNAKNINDINKIINSVTLLEMKFQNLGDEKLRGKLQVLFQDILNYANSIQKLQTKAFPTIKVPKEIFKNNSVLPESELIDFNKKLEEIQNKIENHKQNFTLSPNAIPEIKKYLEVNKSLNDIIKNRTTHLKTISLIIDKITQKENERKNIIKQIKNLEGSPATIANQQKLKELENKKKEIDKEIIKLKKEENKVTLQIANNELKNIDLLQKKKTIINEIKEKLFNLNQQISSGIFNETGAEDLGKSDYFENTTTKYQNIIKNINNYYDILENTIIRPKENELLQLKKSSKITESEFNEQWRQLELQKEEEFAKKKKNIEQATFNYKLGVARGFISQSIGIMDELFQAGYLKNKRYFAIYKAMRVAQTIIDTYASAQKAMASPTLPYPLNFAAAALSIATGMARLAVIKAQKFHTGGYVNRNQFNNQSIGGLRDDEVPAILQKGEYVLSKNDIALIKQASQPNVNVTANAPRPEVIIINDINDEKIGNYLQSRQGREIIRNVVQ